MRGALAAGLAAILLLTGCTSSEPLAEQYRSGSGQGYVSGDGTFREFPRGERGEPVVFSGLTDTGATLSSAELLGQVVIVNFWYADCPPCRAEARDLEALYQKHLDAGATFVGVNVRDQAPTSQAFARTFGVSYPSLIDAQDGRVRLAFAGSVPPSAVPTTIVLDAEGRIAARFLGQITAPNNLDTIIRELLAEGGAG